MEPLNGPLVAALMAPGTEVLDRAHAAFLAALQAPEWHADALCKEYPSWWWFPERSEDTSRPKAVCRRCLVRGECLAWALDQPDTLQGIWAATTRQERRRLRNTNREAA